LAAPHRIDAAPALPWVKKLMPLLSSSSIYPHILRGIQVVESEKNTTFLTQFFFFFKK
jgi:hypothetical protein